MSGLYLPKTTDVIPLKGIVRVPPEEFVMSYDIDTGDWFRQWVSLLDQDETKSRVGVHIHFSDESRCSLDESTRIICKMNRTGKTFSTQVRCLKPGMTCLSYTSRHNAVYVERLELSKPVFVNRFIPKFHQALVVGPGIVICGS